MFRLGIIALAVSLDSLTAGTAFGTSRVRLRGYTIALLSVVSILTVLTGGFLALQASSWISPGTARQVGSVLLALLGLFLVIQAFLSAQELDNTPVSTNPPVNADPAADAIDPVEKPGADRQQILVKAHIAGLVLMVLREPTLADQDRSGTIEIGEAVVLGTALAMDAVALMGGSVILLALAVGIMNGLMFYAGFRLGGVISELPQMKLASRLAPGIILFIMGILRATGSS